MVPVCYLLGRDNKHLAVSVHVLPGQGILPLGRWVRDVFVWSTSLCLSYIHTRLFIRPNNSNSVFSATISLSTDLELEGEKRS